MSQWDDNGSSSNDVLSSQQDNIDWNYTMIRNYTTATPSIHWHSGQDWYTDHIGASLEDAAARYNRIAYSDNPLDISFPFLMTISICFEIVIVIFIILKNRLKRTRSMRNLQTLHTLMAVAAVFITFYSASRKTNNVVIVTNVFLLEMLFSTVLTAPIYPFKYEILSTKKVIIIISCSWFFSAMFVVLSMLIEIVEYHSLLFSTCQVIAAVLFLASSNLYLYIVAKRYNSLVSANLIVAKEKDDTLKSAYICFSILLSFAVLWLPFFTRKMMLLGQRIDPMRNEVFTIVVVYVAFLNSLLDIMIPFCTEQETSSKVILLKDVVHI